MFWLILQISKMAQQVKKLNKIERAVIMISIDRPYFFYKEVEMTDRSKFNVDKDKSKRSYLSLIHI